MKTVSTILAILFTTAAIAQEAPAPAAPAKPQCYSRDEMTKLMMKGGASPLVVARSGESLLEIWGDKEDWVLFRTTRDGTMCKVVQGQGEVHTAKPQCIDPIRCPRV